MSRTRGVWLATWLALAPAACRETLLHDLDEREANDIIAVLAREGVAGGPAGGGPGGGGFVDRHGRSSGSCRL